MRASMNTTKPNNRQHRRGLFFALAIAVFWAVATPALAQTAGDAFGNLEDSNSPGASNWIKTEQTALRLVAATETARSTGTLTLGLHFKMQPGWKIYWRSPGDAGFPPIPDWSASKNLKSAVLRWPAPERFSILGLETLGYKKEVVLPITVRRSDPSKPLELAGTIRYLVCSDICIPYDTDLALTIAPGDGKPSRFAHLINRFEVTVPGDGKRAGLSIDAVETWTEGDADWLRVRAGAVLPFQAPDAYPEGPPELSFSKPSVIFDADGRTVALEMKVFGLKGLSDDPASGPTLNGRTLIITLVDGNRSAEAKLAVTAATGAAAKAQTPSGGADTDSGAALLVILGLAVIGGLILNLMPCVLPVLSLKLLSVVGHGGGERRLVRMSFLASAAGILFAFMVLAGALIALKAGGMVVGWGIQFQQPWFLIAMTVLVVAFACNLWGLFEVRLPTVISDLGEHSSHVHGMGGHFLQGAFATLLATPCSAPFLGTAVGFALARGWTEIAAVFAALGLGLALPYLAVAAFPGLATRLPRPGPWMVTMRRVLSLALVATGVWLLSVLAGNIGITAAAAVGGLAAAGAGLLFLGRRVPGGPGRRAPWGITLAVVAAFLVPGWLGVTPGDGVQAKDKITFSGNGELAKMWTPLDEAAIPGLVAEGKTVFVDVTADWCITCQVNKGLVLNTDAMIKAFRTGGVVLMQADWTRPDPVISAYLARYQRYGIPFNVVYGPGAPGGIVLPELLSKKAVRNALRRASKIVRTSNNNIQTPNRKETIQ
jgi:suppressor for copper-sensitivity B